MLIIRPVQSDDLDDLYVLAVKAGSGMTSLPADRDTLAQSIITSMESFHAQSPRDNDYFLLVLEDTKKQKVVGTAGIHARTGAHQAFFCYRLISQNHYSQILNKQVHHDMLQLNNDYTDCSEVGTLFLDPDYRGNGHWLARSRYLLMGQFPDRFAQHVVAELRGWADENHNSPFWDSLGRHFFQMDYDEADKFCGVDGNHFINDLMPKHPIYTALLSQAAQDVIGKPNDAGRRAMELLEQEGFDYDRVVDVFDAGPILRATIKNLKTIRQMRQGTVKVTDKLDDKATLITNHSMMNFRAIFQPLNINGKNLSINEEHLKALEIKPGDNLNFVENY